MGDGKDLFIVIVMDNLKVDNTVEHQKSIVPIPVENCMQTYSYKIAKLGDIHKVRTEREVGSNVRTKRFLTYFCGFHQIGFYLIRNYLEVKN